MVGTSGVYGEEGIDHRNLELWFEIIEDEDLKVAMHLVVSRTVVSKRVVFMLSLRKIKNRSNHVLHIHPI